jgi:hypothetical protein
LSGRNEGFDAPAPPLALKFQSSRRELSPLAKRDHVIGVSLLLRETGSSQIVHSLLFDAIKRLP